MKKFLRITTIGLIAITSGLLVLIISEINLTQETEANLLSDEVMEEMRKEYTEDQKKFMQNFGRPDSWDIVFNKAEEPIVETWKYMELGEAITFANGKFVDRVEFEIEAPTDSVLIISKIEPKDVYGIDSVFDLNNVLGSRPSAAADMQDVDWMGANKYYEYDEIINAGTHEGELVYIKTKAFYVSISELEMEESRDFRNEIALAN